MIDLEILRSDPDRIRAELKKRNISKPSLSKILTLDSERRQMIGDIENLRSGQNKLSSSMPKLKGVDREKAIKEAKKVSDKIKKLTPGLDRLEKEFFDLVATLPTFSHSTVPSGKSEKDNEVDSIFGEKPVFDFVPKSHWQLAEKMGLIDAKKAAKVSGARFNYMKGDLVLLSFAILRFAMDEVIQKGYMPMLTPTMVKEEAMYGAGMFPIDKNEVYELPKDKLFLIGTSEITLLNYHAADVLDLSDGPVKYTGFTTNYRREAGTYGKDMHGLIRQHQFDKLELFVFSSQEQSWEILDKELLPLAEGLLEKLGVHFRRVILSTADLPRKMQKTYDLEAWLPSEKRYLEVSSISNAGDFQSRRLNIKYKNKDAQKRFAHTLNGTAITFSRFPAIILENFQEADGKVRVPEVLQPYMSNREYIEPQK